MRRRKGETGVTGRQLRLPRNVVYDAAHQAGGPTKVMRELGVSAATWARWRKLGTISDAASALRLAERAEPDDLVARWALARRLAGLHA